MQTPSEGSRRQHRKHPTSRQLDRRSGQPGTRFPAPRSPHNHELRGYGLFPAAWAVIIQASLVLQGYGSRAAKLLCHSVSGRPGHWRGVLVRLLQLEEVFLNTANYQ